MSNPAAVLTQQPAEPAATPPPPESIEEQARALVGLIQSGSKDSAGASSSAELVLRLMETFNTHSQGMQQKIDSLQETVVKQKQRTQEMEQHNMGDITAFMDEMFQRLAEHQTDESEKQEVDKLRHATMSTFQKPEHAPIALKCSAIMQKHPSDFVMGEAPAFKQDPAYLKQLQQVTSQLDQKFQDTEARSGARTPDEAKFYRCAVQPAAISSSYRTSRKRKREPETHDVAQRSYKASSSGGAVGGGYEHRRDGLNPSVMQSLTQGGGGTRFWKGSDGRVTFSKPK